MVGTPATFKLRLLVIGALYCISHHSYFTEIVLSPFTQYIEKEAAFADWSKIFNQM